AQAPGVRLPAPRSVDHPTRAAVARLIRGEVGGLGEAPKRAARPRRGAADGPLAMVGISCRCPGGVSAREEVWQLVAAGRDAVAGLPTDRGWDRDIYDPD
ncbi:hypothetical protein VM98_39180, partial [Streptomyces rubellomurinus subsp. indigoferus]